ncbi:hypothetical protein CYMTET_44685 [Cymbomonas tetramitiformis]|uniref:Uncharacterized protein n=1 Tax=Cymbomonas tetramitiformis TaxID=36881 RepID=A0AAE0BY07_9CHLO|nr:hypothetical protein CYMTET_46274 [Cymbomonas tetramitiformis]KAK3245864.1 hypothetical protein CYMTET_44685 [Cymbomonas tetramitiformis]
MIEKKKLVQKISRASGLRNICAEALEKIQQSDDMCMTMEALNHANFFVKGAHQNVDMNLKSIDEINENMIDLQASSDEIQEALNTGLDTAFSENDLQDELNELFGTATNDTEEITAKTQTPVATYFPNVQAPSAQMLADESAPLAESDFAMPSAPSTVFVLESS